MKTSFRFLTALIFFAFIFLICANLHARGIVFLHTNDFHGHLTGQKLKNNKIEGGIARLAFAIELEKRKARLRGMETLVFDSGDFFMGSPEADLSGGLDLINIMDTIGYNVMTLGNHEFDRGQEGLQKILENLKVPVVCANLKYDSGKLISKVLPWKIIELETMKIGVTGLMTTDLPSITSASAVKGLKIEEPFSAATKAAFEMRGQGADFILILSHLGYDIDKQLAENLSGVDLIIGGHSHTPVLHPSSHGANSVFVAQAGFYGHYLGKIIYDNQSDTPFKGSIIRITSDKFDKMPLITKDVKIINQTVDKALGQIVGQTARALLASIPAEAMEKYKGEELVSYVNSTYSDDLACFKDSSERVLVYENSSGNMVADSMRHGAQSDIAIQNGGGIRSGLSKGDVTLKNIHAVMPFKNDLVKASAKGSVIQKLAERVVSKYDYGFGVVSGMKIYFDPYAPAYSRVKKVTVNGEPLDLEKVYTVATNAFLFYGGDSYTQFTETEIIEEFDIRPVQDCMSVYIGENSPYSVKVDQRLIIVK